MDPCNDCPAKGDIKKCKNRNCYLHRTWYAKQQDGVAASLWRLKNELSLRTDDITVREIFFKINSCLFSEYPPKS